MISTETVFILGAGSNFLYKFPLASDLRKNICKDFPISFIELIEKSDITNKGQLIEEAKDFADKFFKSSIESIDAFLFFNPHLSDVGKIAITFYILNAEKISMFREDCINPSKDWYTMLFNKMIEGLDPVDWNIFGENKVTFITFNYDRSLEFFLYESLMNSFTSADRLDLINELKKIPVYHVYGKPAYLPWEDGVQKLSYRSNFGIHEVTDFSVNLKLINERYDDKDYLKKIMVEISKAKEIYFLGFAYRKENLDILGVPGCITNDHRVYGTAFGVPENEIAENKVLLAKNFDHVRKGYDLPHIEDIDCYTLLRKYPLK